jgi:AraC-like DNA-binding protein
MFSDKPYLVRSACLTGYADLAHSLDIDPFALLRGAGLDRDCVINPERKIPVEAVRRLLHMSGIAAGVDDFGLRLVGARPLSFLGPLALAVRDAATLRPWVEFDRNWNGILLAVRDLDAPLPAADPIMAEHVRQYLEPMLAKADATLSERVGELVYNLLPSGSCFVELLSDRLGMNQRTLRRYLARNGVTFSSIVDAARVDLARRYVEEGDRSLSDISGLLGFSTPSSFSRWFQARFASSPMAWRAKKAKSAN